MRVADCFTPTFTAARPVAASAGRTVFQLPVMQPLRPAMAMAAVHAPVLALRAEPKRAAIRAGRGLIEALDQLKAAVLSGDPGQALAALSSRLEAAGDPSGDLVLDDLLEHIRLRADVELAKARYGVRDQ